MNWTDKEIDKLFKDNANNSSFEYKEAYWKEMEAMLPSNSGKGLLWTTTAVLFIGVLGITSFVNKAETNTNNPILASTQSLNDNSEELSTAQTTNGKISNDNDNVESSELNVKSVSENSVLVEEELINAAGEVQEIETTYTIENINNRKVKSNAKNISVINNPEDAVSIRENVEQNSRENEFLSTQIPQKNSSKSTGIGTDKHIGNLDTKELLSIENEAVQNLASFNHNVKTSLRSSFYIQALGGGSQSLISPSEKQSYSMGVGFGMNMNKGHFVFGAGINGIWAVHNDLILSREAKIYGFGSEVHRYELKYKEMFSLEADLSLGYQFGGSTVRVGVRPSFLIGTKVNYQSNIDENDSDTEEFYGYSEGVNRLGLKPTLGYSYEFRNGVSLGLNVGVQVLEMVDESFVNGVNNTLPIDGQIYLRKSINFRR